MVILMSDWKIERVFVVTRGDDDVERVFVPEEEDKLNFKRDLEDLLEKYGAMYVTEGDVC